MIQKGFQIFLGIARLFLVACFRLPGSRGPGKVFSLNTLVLGVSLTASTSPEEGHTGNQQIFGPSGATTGCLFLPQMFWQMNSGFHLRNHLPRAAAPEADFRLYEIWGLAMLA